jgi:type IV fimbrial biogenesis protein FimT
MKKLTRIHKQNYSQMSKTPLQGFTLIEFMVAILVLSVVLTIGAPSMTETVRNARMTSQTNLTLGMLSYARSEAAKRPGVTITLCASTTTNSASPSCDTDDWENGWFIMTDWDADQQLDNVDEDVNGDGVLDPGEDLNGNGVLDTATDELLRVGDDLSGSNTMRTFGFPNAGAVQFDPDGLPNSSGTFVICDARGEEEAKAIIISVIGHIRAAVDDDQSDDIVNNHEGVNVECPAS